MALTAKKVYAILKRQISDMEAKLNSPVRYRGTVATADLLPLNPDIGDMYNIESKSVYGEAGMNVAWNGVVWDTMGAPIDMSLYLTKEEAEAVIQRLVTEYFEKNPVKPGATTEQAQQIEQNKTDIASLKTETASLKEDISNKITKFYASSQGETHLADSDSGKIMDMMLYGKSEQKQYSGKNLLNATLQTTTKNGVTCTANGDGTYTLNGTATEKTEFIIDVFNIDISKKYKLIAFTKERSYINCFVQLNQSPWTIYGTSTYSQVTITDSENIRLVIAVTKSTTLSNEIIKPMIVDASLYPDTTYDDYEPYTGGIPSPNPDYPQEIKSVVNPTVKVCGKNLFTFSNDSRDINGVIFEAKDGIITAKGTSTKDYTSTYFNFNYPKDIFTIGETYTFSLNSNDANLCLHALYKENDMTDYKTLFDVTTKCATVKIPDNVDLIIRCVVDINATVNATATIQIEKGSEATAYEPYHEQTVALPYTLNAIPVSSGGNVTIDVQQYVSDYFDVERGKLVRMVADNRLLSAYNWNTANEYYWGSVSATTNGKAPITADNSKKMCACNYLFASSTYDVMAKKSGIAINNIKQVVIGLNDFASVDEFKTFLTNNDVRLVYPLEVPEEIDLTPGEIQALKALATYYPTTNISVNSEQLDGYTVFNYPISMENGWNYVKQQIGDTRDYIYDMDARTQDTDLQAAEAYVNSEYAVALTELEV